MGKRKFKSSGKSHSTVNSPEIARNSEISKQRLSARLNGFRLPHRALCIIVFSFSCLLYANTLWCKYAVDDVMVLTDNKFTKKGLDGIKDHFTHDGMEGYYGEQGARTLNGGRYRPLSLATFTLEYELIRKIRNDPRLEITERNTIIGEEDPYLNPALSHGINVLLFSLTGLLIYYLLLLILPPVKSHIHLLPLPFLVAMLYVAHPIHTEAVANIKGRDEIMCLLFSLLSLLAAVKYVKTGNMVHLFWGAPAYFVALLSKENAITFFAIIPLTFFYFTKARIKDYVLTMAFYLVPAAIFLLLRNQYTHSGLTQNAPDILNNPFLYATTLQRYTTTIFTFLNYLMLLVFPHPLTSDYYYNQIPYVGVWNAGVILSALINSALLIIAIIGFKKRSIISYSILFYFITFSIVSNVFFTVGTMMNERFIYISSLGFCILFTFVIVHYVKNQKALATVFLLVLCLFSIKTFTRNSDWKNSLSLSRRDILQSPNSARMQSMYGGELAKEANKQTDTLQKNALLDSAISHLSEAVKILPTYPIALNDLGSSLYNRYHNSEEVIPIFNKAISYSLGGYYDAYFNTGTAYNAENRSALAKQYFFNADALKPFGSDCKYMISQVYAKLNQPDSVEYWLKRGAEIKPLTANDYYMIAFGFGNAGNNPAKAIEYLKKAIELAPKKELYYQNLAEVYGLSGEYNEAIETCKKLIEMNPDYLIAYQHISMYYNVNGNKTMSDQYLETYNHLATLQKKY